MLHDRRRYHELVDPLLRGDYPDKDFNQAAAMAAICIEDEASVRPYMSDIVVALGFLAEVPAGCEERINAEPQNRKDEDPSVTGNTKKDQSTFDRQRAVAEAIEWGSLQNRKSCHVSPQTTSNHLKQQQILNHTMEAQLLPELEKNSRSVS